MSEPRPFRAQRDILRWLPFALVGAALLPLIRALLGGETLFWGLPTLQFYPWREFAFAELRAGRLPAWNPYLGAGAPLLANYQTAIFYPPNWLMLALPGPLAMSLLALAHVLWAALGMWRLAGALGLTLFGRGISALSYALGGYLIARLGSFPTHDAAAWLPWVIWLAHRAITRRGWRDAGGLALAVGLLLLAGHAQTAWYGLLGAGAYALWADRRDSWRLRARGLILAGLGVALGAGIAAVQLIPTAEYLRLSDRSGGLGYAALTNLSYHPARLLTLLMPHFFGTPADGGVFTEGIFFEDAAYLGVIPLIAAGAALVAWLFKRAAPPRPPPSDSQGGERATGR
ncbi:MAG: YfhO family protein [Anaerolineae bacterium]|nr:YfhO family protein [Anaerolineae bacterium]